MYIKQIISPKTNMLFPNKLYPFVIDIETEFVEM